jgi:hypothetical protein
MSVESGDFLLERQHERSTKDGARVVRGIHVSAEMKALEAQQLFHARNQRRRLLPMA